MKSHLATLSSPHRKLNTTGISRIDVNNFLRQFAVMTCPTISTVSGKFYKLPFTHSCLSRSQYMQWACRIGKWVKGKRGYLYKHTSNAIKCHGHNKHDMTLSVRPPTRFFRFQIFIVSWDCTKKHIIWATANYVSLFLASAIFITF